MFIIRCLHTGHSPSFFREQRFVWDGPSQSPDAQQTPEAPQVAPSPAPAQQVEKTVKSTQETVAKTTAPVTNNPNTFRNPLTAPQPLAEGQLPAMRAKAEIILKRYIDTKNSDPYASQAAEAQLNAIGFRTPENLDTAQAAQLQVDNSFGNKVGGMLRGISIWLQRLQNPNAAPAAPGSAPSAAPAAAPTNGPNQPSTGPSASPNGPQGNPEATRQVVDRFLKGQRWLQDRFGAIPSNGNYVIREGSKQLTLHFDESSNEWKRVKPSDGSLVNPTDIPATEINDPAARALFNRVLNDVRGINEGRAEVTQNAQTLERGGQWLGRLGMTYNGMQDAYEITRGGTTLKIRFNVDSHKWVRVKSNNEVVNAEPNLSQSDVANEANRILFNNILTDAKKLNENNGVMVQKVDCLVRGQKWLQDRFGANEEADGKFVIREGSQQLTLLFNEETGKWMRVKPADGSAVEATDIPATEINNPAARALFNRALGDMRNINSGNTDIVKNVSRMHLGKELLNYRYRANSVLDARNTYVVAADPGTEDPTRSIRVIFDSDSHQWKREKTGGSMIATSEALTQSDIPREGARIYLNRVLLELDHINRQA